MIYKHNGSIITDIDGKWLTGGSTPVDPYNPLNLPPNTIRVRTNDGNVPYMVQGTSYETATLVSGTTDVYDVYKSGTSFNNLFNHSNNIIEVLGANTSNITEMQYMFSICSSLTTIPLFNTSKVTDMKGMFFGCTPLTTVPLFDTSKVTNMADMFHYCSSLTTVPLFDTSSVTNMNYMFDACASLTSVPLFDTHKVTSMNYTFYDCTSVESGALALYQQASTQTTPPSSHAYPFCNCGYNTVTGAAELQQIPISWGGMYRSII